MENQRIRISKTMLKSALLELLQHEHINRITISQICQEAQINRTTFYKYYGNQYDLLADIEHDFFVDLEENINSDKKTEIEILTHALSYLYRNKEKFNVLTTSLPGDEFLNHLFNQKFLTNVLNNKIAYNYSEMTFEYASVFFIHGIYVMVRTWLNKEHPEPPEELAMLMLSLRKKFE